MYKFEDINELPQNNDIRSWINLQLKNNSAKTLLAFADDGVIWGNWDGTNLVAAQNAPALRGETLQQAHLFDANEELRLFRDELGGWKSVKVSSDVSDAERVIVEKQILWGDELDNTQPAQSGFLHARSDRKGIPMQTIPVQGTLNDKTCIRLDVHHLVDYNGSGEAYIVASRLAGLSITKKEA